MASLCAAANPNTTCSRRALQREFFQVFSIERKVKIFKNSISGLLNPDLDTYSECGSRSCSLNEYEFIQTPITKFEFLNTNMYQYGNTNNVGRSVPICKNNKTFSFKVEPKSLNYTIILRRKKNLRSCKEDFRKYNNWVPSQIYFSCIKNLKTQVDARKFSLTATENCTVSVQCTPTQPCQCCGSVTFLFRSGSCYFCQLPSTWQQKFFFKFFACTFWSYIYIIFQHFSHNSRNQDIPYYFCSII